MIMRPKINITGLFFVFFISYETFILNSSCVLLLVLYARFKGFFYLFGQRILNFPGMDGGGLGA